MQFNSTDMSLQEWPTLDDVNKKNMADGRLAQNVRSASSENGIDNTPERASSARNGGSNTDNTTKAGKKNSSKRNHWKPLQINPQPYKQQRGAGRRFNDSHKSLENGHSNHQSNYSNGFTNGRGNPRSRGTRGNRGRGSLSYRSRRDSKTYPSGESTAETSEVKTYVMDPSCYYSKRIEDLIPDIRRQIEYYFSEENLNVDIFIRRKMNDQGYVPLSLIATFNLISRLTNDLQLIVEAVRDSSKLDLKDDFFVRPVVDPLRWPTPDVIPQQQTLSLRTDVPEFYPGQPYVGIDRVTEQMNNLHVTGAALYHPSLATPVNGQYPPQSVESINGFSVLGVQDSNGVLPYGDDPEVLGACLEQDPNGVLPYEGDPEVLGACLEQDSNGVLPYGDDPEVFGACLEQDSNGVLPYGDDPEVLGASAGSPNQQTNGFDHYAVEQAVCAYYSNDSSPVQEISGYEYFSQPIQNGVVFYNNDQESNEGGCYSVLSTAEEKLTNGADDTEEPLHNKSPEPSR